MRKRLVTLVALAVILGLSIPAGAVQLHFAHRDGAVDCKKSTEGDFYSLHFVNNQIKNGTDGADIRLWVTTDGLRATNLGPLAPDKVNRNNVQWTVTLPDNGLRGNILVNAWTTVGDSPAATPISSNGPGKLVLSDYKCKLQGGTQEP